MDILEGKYQKYKTHNCGRWEIVEICRLVGARLAAKYNVMQAEEVLGAAGRGWRPSPREAGAVGCAALAG